MQTGKLLNQFLSNHPCLLAGGLVPYLPKERKIGEVDEKRSKPFTPLLNKNGVEHAIR